MGTSAGDVQAVSDDVDVTITTCVSNVGMGTSDGDVTVVADVNEMAVMTGVGDVETGIAQVTWRRRKTSMTWQ